MNETELRQQVKQYVEQLSVEHLAVAADFLAYLLDKESEEATQELLNIPGFLELHERGKQEIAQGKVTPVEQLKRKY